MATRFMTDPHAMRSMAGRFEMHAQTVSDEARKMWSSSMNMLHSVRDGLVRDANNYETQEQASQQMLSH